MEKLACEMCGGNLLKKGEVFECQSCGLQYTKEEIRKIIVAGNVRVEGVVQVDNSRKIENMMINAKRSYEDGRFAKAQEQFNEVLLEDPNNAEAILYEGLSNGWQGNTVIYKMDQVANAAKRAIDIASKSSDQNKIEELALLVYGEITNLGSSLILLCVNDLKRTVNDNNRSIEEMTYRMNKMDIVYGDFDGLRREADQ